jgi:hypothetical protein
VPEALAAYNKANGTGYTIKEQDFPKKKPYGWANYPYDYWNIWVKHAGGQPYMEEPTLEILTRDWDVIVFKHCFPVSNVEEDTGQPDIESRRKSIENYKLQYDAIKRKLRTFPDTRFIVWTGALLSAQDTAPGAPERAAAFRDWVCRAWDEKGDNIFLWDFATLEGDGGLILKKDYEEEPGDSHPGPAFCTRAAVLFVRRLVDVIEGRGDTGNLTGG